MVCTCEFVLLLLDLSPSFLLVDGKSEKRMFTMLLVHRERPPVALTDKKVAGYKLDTVKKLQAPLEHY